MKLTPEQAFALILPIAFLGAWILTLHWRIDELEKYVEEQKRKDNNHVRP